MLKTSFLQEKTILDSEAQTTHSYVYIYVHGKPKILLIGFKK